MLPMEVQDASASSSEKVFYASKAFRSTHAKRLKHKLKKYRINFKYTD
jgi:hypothetical protein